MSTSDLPPFPDDEQNPYAPPRSDVGPELLPTDLRPIPFTLGDVLSRTWEIYRDRMGMCVGVVFGCLVIYLMAFFALMMLQAAAPQARNPQAFAAAVTLLGNLGLNVLQIWLYCGLFVVMLDIARGREASFGDLFSGGRYILRAFVALILFWLMMLVPIVLGMIPGGLLWVVTGRDSMIGPITLALGFIIGYIFLIIVSLRLSQYLFLIVDRDAGPIESLQTSAMITRGNAWMLFVLYLLVFAINIGGLLACFVGLLFTLPYTAALFTVTYLALTGQASADPYAKGEPLADLEPL